MLNLSQIAEILKPLLDDNAMADGLLRDHPLMDMIARDNEWKGDGTSAYPVRIGGPQNASHTFSRAQRRNVAGLSTHASEYVKFIMERRRDFATVHFDEETVRAAIADEGAFIDAKADDLSNMFVTLGQRLARSFYGDGSASIGQVAAVAGAPTNTITLTRRGDARHFGIGQVIESALTLSGAVKTPATAPTVTKVDLTAGVITLSVDPTSFGGNSIAVNDYLFSVGDSANGGTSYSAEGLAAIIPLVAPGPSDSFRGVNRSVAPEFLSGFRLGSSSVNKSVYENLIDLSTLGREFGSTASKAIVNPAQMGALCKELGSAVVRSTHQSEKFEHISFEGVVVRSGTRRIEVFEDPDCPADLLYLLDPSDITLKSLGGYPIKLGQDHQYDDALAMELRYGGWFNWKIKNPGKHGVCQLGGV